MKKLKTAEKYSDDLTAIDDIYMASNQIRNVIKEIKQNYISSTKIKDIFYNIYQILDFWTGCTYIGHKKSNELTKAFNQFYNNLLELLLILKNMNYKCYFVNALYQGPVYRVLGHGDSSEKQNFIEPVYNNVFVSWSKNKNIPTPNMLQKLYGPITLVEGYIENNSYGIDLTIFNVSKDKEDEIIFPMRKEIVKNIEYINRNGENDDSSN